MYCIIVVGMTGQGKSRFIHDYINGKRSFVFDVQNEYLYLSLNPNAEKARVIHMNEKLFIEQCEKKQNTICVFEEATFFFEGRTEKDLRRVVGSKRHSKNTFIFCFHSISAIPPRLMQLCNYVVMFKTNDEDYQIEQKFPSLYPYYLKVKKLKHQQFLTIKTIPQ